MQLAGRIVLVLALLIARGGAVTHAYSHLASDPPALPAQQTCDECLSFAPLLTVVGGSGEPLLIENHAVDELASFTAVPVACVSRPSPFQSRAPPALL